MECPRCFRAEDLIGEFCNACRAFMLGDSTHDPSGRPVAPLGPGAWPFRDWGPLVDLRDPDDLNWIADHRLC